MEFTYDEVHSAVAQASRDALEHAGEDPWKALAGAGLLTLGVPQRLGGEGLSMLETAIVLTEIGRRALRLPALATLAMGVLPVARFAGEAVQDSLLREGKLLTAAVSGLTISSTVDGVAYGVPWGALDLTAGHVGTREQFGKPLAAFQAVAQQIADVYIAWRTTHLAALAACADPADAPLAAYWLRNEAPAAMRTCHHLHGGIGLDIGYPLHRYSSMLKDLLRLVGMADASRT